MTVNTYEKSSVTIVEISGSIRVESLSSLRDVLEKLENDGVDKIAVDFSNVDFIDSSGLGLVVNFSRKLSDKNKFFCLFNYQKDIKDLFEITGIEQAVSLFDNFENVLKSINNN